MRNWWYLLCGLPIAFYLAILLGPSSFLIFSAKLPGDKKELACTYFTGVRTAKVREAHFCDQWHILVKTDHVISPSPRSR